MLFGQHAVGLHEAVLGKLEATDAKYLRALAKCPAHLRHESTSKLRGVRSMTEALAARLESRRKNCSDQRSIHRFTEQLRHLRDVLLARAHAAQHGLHPVDVARPVRGMWAVLCNHEPP